MTLVSLLATIVVSSNAVSFTAVSADPGLDQPIEYLFAGPGSEYDYESMFLTEDSVRDIAAAFAKAGLPLGTPVATESCRFWPIGTKLEMKPDLWTLVRDARNERKQSAVWTGGTREADGSPVAHTNMPGAVFALYSLPQSLMQFDDALDKSAVYGRFMPAVKIAKGEKRTFTFTWTGETNGGKHEKIPDFPPEMTVESAMRLAGALAELDSPETKVNGFKEGQFYYRAFIPRESWRDRTERLTQPYEVRFRDGKPVLTVIAEDWSDPNSTDPKLTAREVPFESVRDRKDCDTCFVYAAKGTPLSEIYSVRKLVPACVVNWYVFPELTP